MATSARSIRLHPVTYRALQAEAARLHVEPDELADQLVREQLLSIRSVQIREALGALDGIGAPLPGADAVQLVHEGREELDRRSSAQRRPS